jgi:hypothetical protein
MSVSVSRIGLSDKYEVDTEGQIYSNDYNHTGKRKVLKQYMDQDGYPYVMLNIDGKRYKRVVHRLIAAAFLPQIEGKSQVNHKNGIRHDNRVENLEWVTSQENILHSWRNNGRKHSDEHNSNISARSTGELNPKAKLNSEQAKQIRMRRLQGESLKSLSQEFGIGTSQISAIARGKIWKSI